MLEKDVVGIVTLLPPITLLLNSITTAYQRLWGNIAQTTQNIFNFIDGNSSLQEMATFGDLVEHFSPFKLSSAAIKIGVWINSAGLNDLGQP